jgi:hypothetical protein
LAAERRNRPEAGMIADADLSADNDDGHEKSVRVERTLLSAAVAFAVDFDVTATPTTKAADKSVRST